MDLQLLLKKSIKSATGAYTLNIQRKIDHLMQYIESTPFVARLYRNCSCTPTEIHFYTDKMIFFNPEDDKPPFIKFMRSFGFSEPEIETNTKKLNYSIGKEIFVSDDQVKWDLVDFENEVDPAFLMSCVLLDPAYLLQLFMEDKREKDTIVKKPRDSSAISDDS